MKISELLKRSPATGMAVEAPAEETSGSAVLPPCHWSTSVALDPRHRPQSPDRPSSTVRREWCRYPQEAYLLDATGVRYRRLLASEVARLQGFPEDWGRAAGLGDLDLIRGYGNAVPPPLAEAIVSTLAARTPGGIRTTVEICAGFGGIALGASRARDAADRPLDVEHLALVDFWKPAADVLRTTGPWSRERVHVADVRAFDWSFLAGEVDLLSGGPPCQPWSLGGRGMGAEDDRDLLGHTPELVSWLRPRAFVFENVPGLMSWANIEYAEWLVQRLQEPGYGVAVGKFNAADFGVPQVRRRIFIVGIRDVENRDVHAFFDALASRRTHADPRRALPPGRQPWVSLGEALPGWDAVAAGWRRWIALPRPGALEEVLMPTDPTQTTEVVPAIGGDG